VGSSATSRLYSFQFLPILINAEPSLRFSNEVEVRKWIDEFIERLHRKICHSSIEESIVA